jgi:hypothetical protein
MKPWKIIFVCVFISGCQSRETADNKYEKSNTPSGLVDSKYSLSSDRQAFDDIRSSVPEQKKRENDELAFVLNLLSEVKLPPSEIRSKFDSVVRKKREVFDKDARKEREEFNKQERQKRDDFLKNQDLARKEFNAVKHSKDERDRFFASNDEARKTYFANQREKRDDFESSMRERRKNFDDYIRERQNYFNQELRSYSKKYEDLKKAERKNQNSSLNYPGNGNISNEIRTLEEELIDARARMDSNPLESGQ